MRVSAERREQTRQRIVEEAGRLFRQHGIDGVGVDAIMHAAGLTHGGFYAYFASKEALAAEVATVFLGRSAAKWEEIGAGADKATALARIVDSYLDPAHVARLDRGCMLPALGAEVARRGDRTALTHELQRMVSALEQCLPEGDPARAKAALAELVGAVLLARVADDEVLAADFLTAAKKMVLPGKSP